MLSYRERPRRSRAPVFYFLLALVFVGVNFLLADKAHAAHGPDMTVEFQELELFEEGRNLVVDYRVRARDWREMKRAGIEPRLNLYVRDRRRGAFSYAYSVPLSRRAGSIEYPRQVKLRGTKVVEFELVGFSGFDRISQTRFGESCGERVRLRVSRARGGGHADRPDRGGNDHDRGTHRPDDRDRRAVQTAAIIRACKAASSSISVDKCLARARALPPRTDAVATVKACGDSSSWNSDILSCLSSAKELTGAADKTIRACDDQTTHGSEFRRCLKKASKHRHRRVAEVVKTCGEVTTFSSEFGSCLDRSRTLGPSASRIIRACEAATTFRSEFNACLTEASRV